MDKETKTKDVEERCSLCGKPLYGETWTDSQEYGDCHERCLREVEGGQLVDQFFDFHGRWSAFHMPRGCEPKGYVTIEAAREIQRIMENWKYNIGDFVTPVVMHKSEHATKMIVTSRITEEYARHIERSYLCSHYKLGDYVRQRILESELTRFPI